jgi:hypothetical protein
MELHYIYLAQPPPFCQHTFLRGPVEHLVGIRIRRVGSNVVKIHHDDVLGFDAVLGNNLERVADIRGVPVIPAPCGSV